MYLTEFFAGMSVVAVELGARQLLAPYFSSSQIVWTIIIGTIMIANGAWKYLWRKKCGPVAGPGQTVPQNTDRCDLDRTDTVVGKYIILGISALLIFTVSSNFLIIACICGMYGDFCIPTVFTRHSDAIPCEILGGQS